MTDFKNEPFEDVLEAQKRVIDAIALLIKACLDKIEAGRPDMVPVERKELAASIAFQSVHEFCLMLGRSVEEDIRQASRN